MKAFKTCGKIVDDKHCNIDELFIDHVGDFHEANGEFDERFHTTIIPCNCYVHAHLTVLYSPTSDTAIRLE